MTPDERMRLKDILCDIGGIIDIGARYSFLADALYHLKDRRNILRQINFGADALNYLNFLLSFLERWNDGGEAFATFLNAVSEQVSDKDAQFIRGLIRKSATTDWKGVDNPAWVQEKIIGENTLEPFSLIHRILQVGRAVVWIESPAYDRTTGTPIGTRQCGTGFLVAPDLILTNNHVISNPTAAIQSVVRFDYDGLSDTNEYGWNQVGFKPNGVFLTDPQEKYDCTLLQLAKPTQGITPLQLHTAPVFVGNRVPIIQHPGGEGKQISQRNNFVAYVDDTELQYTTSTRPGSSGSPVFDTSYQVVGLHTSGGDIVEPASNRTYFRNRGTRIGAVLEALETANPKQFAAIRDQLSIK